MGADFEIKINDNTTMVEKAFESQLQTALEMIGTQAESHAKQIVSDTLVYGGIDLMKYGEKDNSRVDFGAMRNSIAHTTRDNDVYIGTNLDYAVYHELGTGVYASQGNGRKSPWYYKGRDGKTHRTQGLPPIHFLKKAASEHTDEYKAILKKHLSGK